MSMFSFRKKKKKSVPDLNLNGANGRHHIPPAPIAGESPVHDEDGGSSVGSSMISLNLPDVTNATKMRVVKLQRRPAGDFGIVLLKGNDTHYVEGGAGLFPGDRLIEVNGENVEASTDQHIAQLISETGAELTLVVQGASELAELHSRISPDRRDNAMTNSTISLTSVSSFRSEVDEPWQHSRRVWYVQPEGFTAGTILPSTAVIGSQSSSVLLRLDNGQKMVNVDEYDTEPANPPKYDRAENIASLPHLNESCVLHTLRQRFGSNLIHTQAANILLLINPSRKLSVYNTKVMGMFRSMHYNKMPPHLYKTAKHAHLRMMATRQEQSIVLTGPTGSGKSTALHYMVNYYAQVYCSPKSGVSPEKFTAALALLDSFGCCLSESNTHSTRFTSMMTLSFTAQGMLTGAQSYTCLLDRFRVVQCGAGELGYHIFYQMIEGSDDSLRRELQLGSKITENNAFLPPLTEHSQRKSAAEHYAKTLEAFRFLGGVSIPEVKGLLSLLSSILHLGRTGAVTNQNGIGARFANPTAAQMVASILGIKYDNFERQMMSAYPLSSETDPAKLLNNAIEDLAMALYELVFSAVNSLINRALATPGRSPYSLVIADMPGFQNPARHASLQHLLMNYASERMQSFFQNETFTKVLNLYEQEEIQMNFTDIPSSPKPIIEVIDKYFAQGGMQGSTNSVSDTKGLFWILDEESMFPGATENTFMERALMHHADTGNRGYSLIRQSGPTHFVMAHCNHSVNVEYDCAGWLTQARDTNAARYAKTIVTESTSGPIVQLFQGKGAGAVTKGSPQAKALADGTSTFMRQVNSRKGHALLTSASLKPQSRCLNYKFQLDYVFDTLRRTNPHFVQCYTPRSPHRRSEAVMDISHMRNQLRANGLLQAVRIYRQGYPDSLHFADFRRQFEVLRVAPLSVEDDRETEFDEREAVMTILEDCEQDPTTYRVGISKVFFRSGVLASLQMEKEQKLNNFVIALQSLSRGALARNRLQALQMKHSAMTVIQRNAQIHSELQAWPWWKLFTKVKPLIGVQCTSKEMEKKEAEMAGWVTKVTKLEVEVKDLKESNTELSAKTEDLENQLAEERESAVQVGSMYESEVVGRRNQENLLAESKDKFESLVRENELLKTEIEEARVSHVKSNESLAPSSGLGSEEDEENSAQFWRQKYIQATSDLESAKKSFEAETEHAGDAVKSNIKQVQRKLQEVTDEKEHQENLAANYKKVQQKQAEEIADLKLNLEQIQSRNTELERKQKRFDQELAKANHGLKGETSARERTGKERDTLQAEVLALKEKCRISDNELDEAKKKLISAECSLNDMSRTGIALDQNEVVQLKKNKRDLEEKVEELEEELEEQNCKIDTVTALKTKWEMEAGSLRAQIAHETESKEDELAELRESLHKKITSLEQQLEEEYNNGKTALKQKRELERKMADIRDNGVDEEDVRRLKKQLARAKALYRDAQQELEERAANAVNKTQLNNLKAQIEDLQDSLSSAQRAKRASEQELDEAHDRQQELETAKNEAENRLSSLQKQVSDSTARVEEMEEELEEAERKARTTTVELVNARSEISTLGLQHSQATLRVSECDRQIQGLQAELLRAKKDTNDKDKLVQLESKVRELESNLELEKMQASRHEKTVTRLKDSLTKTEEDLESKRSAEASLQNELRRLQRQLREANNLANDVDTRESEWNKKRRELEEMLEERSIEVSKAEADNRTLKERLNHLQNDLELSEGSIGGSSEDYPSDFDDSMNVPQNIRSMRKSPSRSGSPSSLPNYKSERRRSETRQPRSLNHDPDHVSPEKENGVAEPPSSQAKRRSERRKSRDSRTQKSISAADISAARALAAMEEDQNR